MGMVERLGTSFSGGRHSGMERESRLSLSSLKDFLEEVIHHLSILILQLEWELMERGLACSSILSSIALYTQEFRKHGLLIDLVPIWGLNMLEVLVWQRWWVEPRFLLPALPFPSICCFGSSLDCLHSSWLYYSLCSLQDLRVPAHAKVVITAPDRHILWGHRCFREVLGKGICISPAVHSLENTVGVVLFLLHDLIPEKLVITKDMVSCKSRDGDKKNSFKITSWQAHILFIQLILPSLVFFPLFIYLISH